jgi:hypothetical protein
MARELGVRVACKGTDLTPLPCFGPAPKLYRVYGPNPPRTDVRHPATARLRIRRGPPSPHLQSGFGPVRGAVTYTESIR